MSRPIDGLPGARPAAIAPGSFTVIVRTQGRRPRSLREALDSIAAQTHDHVDTVVVVHGDTAATSDVREQIGARAGVTVVNTTDTGRGAPLNVGLRAAAGDYVCFLDDDDLAEPNWIAEAATAAGFGTKFR